MPEIDPCPSHFEGKSYHCILKKSEPMIKRTKASLPKLIIHKIGNKFNDTRNLFSEATVVFDEDSYNLLLPYLLKPFANLTESYRFHHHADLELNEMRSYCKAIFEDEEVFADTSRHILTHLYEQSNSANIKTGDVLIALLEGIEFNEVSTNAIGVFKIENKTEFFQTYLEGSSLDIAVQKGISSKKIDKGCLVVNYQDDEGYVVLSVDNNNYDAQYWLRNFLHVKYADDKNFHTKAYLDLCREFSGEVLKSEYGTREQSHFLARAMDYFKENDTLNIHDFKEEVLDMEEQRGLFDEYKKSYETEREVLVRNQFHVSEAVVKKQKQKWRTEIRLDTNIQIRLDVDAPEASSEFLELGYDEEKKMRFYKVYFNEEA